MWDEADKEDVIEKHGDIDKREGKHNGGNPFKTLLRQLSGWSHQLPVIGLNSGKYDISVIKLFLVPYLLTPSENEDEDKRCFIIKLQNTFM